MAPDSFYKIIVTENLEKNEILIPARFSVIHYNNLECNAVLVVNKDVIWDVCMNVKSPTYVTIEGDGLAAFLSYYNVKPGHIIVFHLFPGSFFQVSIFDHASCEISYPSQQLPHVHCRLPKNGRIPPKDDGPCMPSFTRELTIGMVFGNDPLAIPPWFVRDNSILNKSFNHCICLMPRGLTTFSSLQWKQRGCYWDCSVKDGWDVFKRELEPSTGDAVKVELDFDIEAEVPILTLSFAKRRGRDEICGKNVKNV